MRATITAMSSSQRPGTDVGRVSQMASAEAVAALIAILGEATRVGGLPGRLRYPRQLYSRITPTTSLPGIPAARA